jgi:hypothetical protein
MLQEMLNSLDLQLADLVVWVDHMMVLEVQLLEEQHQNHHIAVVVVVEPMVLAEDQYRLLEHLMVVQDYLLVNSLTTELMIQMEHLAHVVTIVAVVLEDSLMVLCHQLTVEVG